MCESWYTRASLVTTVPASSESEADSPSARLRGMALSVAGSGQFSATVFDGDQVLQRVNADTSRLAELAEGVPVVTDDPRRAEELLAQAGVAQPLVWDVLELAALLVPASPRRRAGVGRPRFSGIVVDGSRLLARQAQCVLMLFELLLAMLEQIETHTLLHVVRLAGGLDWPLRTLFTWLQHSRALSPLEIGPLAAAAPIGGWIAHGATGRKRRADAADAHAPPAELAPIDPDAVARCLAPEGAIAARAAWLRGAPGTGAHGPARGRHAQHGRPAPGRSGHGHGQEPGVPAAGGAARGAAISGVWSSRRRPPRCRTSCSSTTCRWSRRPGARTPALRATVLKGRNNYLCLRRWQTLLHAGDLSAADRMLLIKTLFWLPHTATGDRAELHLSPAEEDAWQRLSAVTEACTPLRCPYHRIGVCFLARARRAAEESHIVIANHALLLSDLVSRSRVLPEYDVLIVDEAHHLEDEATQQLGWRLGERELLNRLERLWSLGLAGSGAIAEALGADRARRSGPRLPRDVRPSSNAASRPSRSWARRSARFFEALLRLLDDPELLARRRRRQHAARHRRRARGLELAGARAGRGPRRREHAQQVERTIVEVTGRARSAARGQRRRARPGGGAERTSRLLARRAAPPAARASTSRARARVHWISGGGRFRGAWLNAAPLDVARPAARSTVRAPEATMLVSATLAIGGSFDYVKRRLGLDDAARGTRSARRSTTRARRCCTCPTTCPTRLSPAIRRSVERTDPRRRHATRAAARWCCSPAAPISSATYLALREPARGARHHAAGAGHRRKLAHAVARVRSGAARAWCCSAPTRSGKASTWSAMR